MRTGQVIGSTDRMGGEADTRPIHYKDVMATLYNRLGIDIADTAVPDTTERPNFLLPGHEPIAELV